MALPPTTVDVDLAAWIRALPKAEVHLHLEGCVPPALARGAARTSAGPAIELPVRDLAGLLRYLDWSCAQITTGAQLAEIAYATLVRAAENGVHHVDVIANPTHWPAFAGRLGTFVAGLDEGFAAAERAGLGTATLALSLKRTQSALEASELVEWILANASERLVALSLDGDERDGAASHTDRFVAAFARARAGGLRRCVHAGESSGAAGVRAALEALGAERIDHGIRCIEDPAVVAELVARAVPLDVCPSSNVLLGVAPSLAAHPLEALRRAGVRVSINTDDPLLFGVDVVGEYLDCATTFSWDRAALRALARVAIESCFAPAPRRSELLAALDGYDR